MALAYWLRSYRVLVLLSWIWSNSAFACRICSKNS
jgi:hypothetical protein